MDLPARQGHPGHAPDHPHAGHAHQHADGAAKTVAGLKDPVCGMAVTEQSPHHVEHEGRPYYFCSAKCQAKFVAEPGRYLHGGIVDAPAAARRRRLPAPSTPARCTRRSVRTIPATAPSAA